MSASSMSAASMSAASRSAASRSPASRSPASRSLPSTVALVGAPALDDGPSSRLSLHHPCFETHPLAVLAAGRHPASLHGRPRSTGARPHRSPRERFSLECDSRLAAPSSATPGLRLPRGSRSRGRLRALAHAERPHAERPHAERDAPSDEATSDLMTTSHSPSRQSFEAPPRSFVRRTVRPFDLLTARPSDRPTIGSLDHRTDLPAHFSPKNYCAPDLFFLL